MDEARDEWLTLSETARLLGVHPSTVRAWSDKGLLPVYRTQGGHRRYRRSEVELWAKTHRQKSPVSPQDVIRMAIRYVRVHVAEGRLEQQDWYRKLNNEESRAYYRYAGRLLLTGLLAYLTENGEEALAQAHILGYDYAIHARRFGLSFVEATQAFLFFRNTVLEAMVHLYAQANVLSGEAWEEMLRRFHEFTDQILIKLLETFQALGA